LDHFGDQAIISLDTRWWLLFNLCDQPAPDAETPHTSPQRLFLFLCLSLVPDRNAHPQSVPPRWCARSR
jgi:hypothetical protein